MVCASRLLLVPGMDLLAYRHVGARESDSPIAAMDARNPERTDEKGRTRSGIEAAILASRDAAAKRESARIPERERLLHALSLPLDETVCLAYLRRERRCLATAGELNARLSANPGAAGASGESEDLKGGPEDIRSARQAVLGTILQERHLEALAERVDQGDLQSAGKAAWQEHLNGMAMAMGTGRLHKLYRKHYKDLFAAKRKPQVLVLGSSDSAFVDSLAGTFIASGQIRGNRPSLGNNKDAPGRVFQWREIPPRDLPRELAHAVDSLEAGSVSRPIRCRFAWLTVAVARVGISPATQYQDALPLLLELATLEELPATSRNPYAESMPSQGNVEGASGAGKPPARETNMDVWLLPPSANRKGIRTANPAWGDTALVSCLRLRYSDLPMPISDAFIGRLERDGTGYLQNRFGNWYFRISEAESRNALATAGYAYTYASAPGHPSAPPSETPGLSALEQAKADAMAKEIDFKSRFAAGFSTAMAPGAEEAAGADALYAIQEKWMAEDVAIDTMALKLEN